MRFWKTTVDLWILMVTSAKAGRALPALCVLGKCSWWMWLDNSLTVKVVPLFYSLFWTVTKGSRGEALDLKTKQEWNANKTTNCSRLAGSTSPQPRAPRNSSSTQPVTSPLSCKYSTGHWCQQEWSVMN